MPYVENTDLTQFWRQEHGSTVSFFPFPFSKSKGIIKSGHFYLPSTSISSPSSKADAWAFIWPMIGNVQLLPILSTALSPVLWYIQEKNHQVLVEWILIALQASHFNLTAFEVYESNLFCIYFQVLGLLIHTHPCHLLSGRHKYHIKGLRVQCILHLCVLASSVQDKVWLSLALCLGKVWLSLALAHVHSEISKSSSKMTFFWRSNAFKHLRTIWIFGASALLAITASLLPSTFSQYSSYKRLAHNSLWVKCWNDKHSLPRST